MEFLTLQKIGELPKITFPFYQLQHHEIIHSGKLVVYDGIAYDVAECENQNIMLLGEPMPDPTIKIQIAIDLHGVEYIFAGYEPHGKMRVTHPNGINCTVFEQNFKIKTCVPNHILRGHDYNYTADGKFIS